MKESKELNVLVLTGPDTSASLQNSRDNISEYVKDANSNGSEKSHIIHIDTDNYLDKIDQELKKDNLQVSDKTLVLYYGHGELDKTNPDKKRHVLIVGTQPEDKKKSNQKPTIEVLKGIQERFPNAKNFAIVACYGGQITDDLLNDKSISSQLSDGTSVSSYIKADSPLRDIDTINWLKVGFENTKDKIPDNIPERFFIKKGMIIDDNKFSTNLNLVYKKTDDNVFWLDGRFLGDGSFKFHPDLKTEFLGPKDKESVNSMIIQRNDNKWGEYLESYLYSKFSNKDGMVDDATKYFDQYSKESKLKTLSAIMSSYTEKENNIAIQKKLINELTGEDLNKINPINYSNTEVVKMILDKPGFDVATRESNGDTLLHKWTRDSKTASELLNHKEILDKFRENGISPFGSTNNKQETVLHKIFSNPYRVIEQEGAKSILTKCSKEEINAQDNLGNTPIHLLASEMKNHYHPTERAKLFDILIENGADPNIPNNKGETALQMISKQPNILMSEPEVTAKIIEMSDETSRQKIYDTILNNPIEKLVFRDGLIEKIQTNHPEIAGTQEFKDFYRQVQEQEYDKSLKVSEPRISRNPEALMRQVIGIEKNNPDLAKTEEFQAFSRKVEELYAEKLKKPESKNFKPLDKLVKPEIIGAFKGHTSADPNNTLINANGMSRNAGLKNRYNNLK